MKQTTLTDKDTVTLDTDKWFDFEFMAQVDKGKYMFIIKAPPKWNVISFNEKTKIVLRQACQTDSRMLRYIRRKTGKIPIIPTMELQAIRKVTWNDSDDNFIIFGKRGHVQSDS